MFPMSSDLKNNSESQSNKRSGVKDTNWNNKFLKNGKGQREEQSRLRSLDGKASVSLTLAQVR